MFKRNVSFYKRNKEIISKTWTLHERIVHIKKKEKVNIMNFWKEDLLKGVNIKKEICFNAGIW